MLTFKSKSLIPCYSDEQIKNGCFSIGFVSFERALKSIIISDGLNYDNIMGYRITEQGIEVIWKS